MKKKCNYCINCKTDEDLTENNDLSYINIGKTKKGAAMYIRAGDGKPIAIITSIYNKEKMEDIAILETNYCPFCGRKTNEYKKIRRNQSTAENTLKIKD